MQAAPANANEADVLPLPAPMRRLLLDLLSLGYPAGAAQANLGTAPDGAVAWQVQSMLDDYADHSAFAHEAPASNDNDIVFVSGAANDNLAEAA